MGGNLKNKLDNHETKLDTGLEWNRLERHFKREKIDDLESNLDIDEEWSRLEQHFERKKKRRVLFWILFGIGMAIVSWITYQTWQTDEHFKREEPKADVVDVIDDFREDIILKTKETAKQFTRIESQVPLHSRDAVSKEIVSAKTKTAQNQVITTNTSTFLNELLFEDKLQTNEKIFIDENNEILNNKISTIQTNSVENSDVSNPPFVTLEDTDFDIQLGAEAPTRNTIEYSDLQPVMTLLGFLELPFPRLVDLYPSVLASEDTRKWSYSLTFSSQAGKVDKMGESMDFNLEGEYIYSHNPLEAFTNSLLIKKRIAGGFHLQSGLSFMHVNELMEFQTQIIEEDVLANQTNVVGLDAIGGLFDRTGSLNQFIRYDVNVMHHNTYQLLSLPIHLIYQFEFNQFNWSLGGGYELPLVAKYKGKGIDVDGFPYILDGNVDITKIRSYHFESTLTRPLGKRLSFGIMTSFDYRSNNITHKNMISRQSYRLLNGGLTLNYKLH